MENTLTISVTAENISAGLARSSCLCPIALAAMRATGKYVTVGSGRMSVWAESVDRPHRDCVRYNFPPEAAAFIRSFDAGRPVEPFEFTAVGE
jgi:hypothetical protein